MDYSFLSTAQKHNWQKIKHNRLMPILVCGHSCKAFSINRHYTVAWVSKDYVDAGDSWFPYSPENLPLCQGFPEYNYCKRSEKGGSMPQIKWKPSNVDVEDIDSNDYEN